MKKGLVASVKARMGDPLRRSADALIIGTGLTSLLGLAFWALAARWLPTEAVGVGAALMSTVTLLANFATLGMRNGLLRFLPAAGSGTPRLILTCYAFCAGAAMLAAGIFLAGQPVWAEKLGFLRESPLAVLAFVLGTAVWVVFVLQDQVLIGLRRTGWVPIQNGVSSVLKIAALPLLASTVAWAVFAATVLPAVLAVLFVTALVLRFARQAAALDPRPPAEARVPLARLVRFAAPDHLASLLWFATTDVLTLIVLHVAGAEASAYWFMANTVGYALYLVTSNVGSALIAESVHDPDNATAHARRALLHSAQLVVPAALAGILLAPLVLHLMGPHYAENATGALRLILASAIPQLIVGIGISTARVRGDMRTVLGVYAFTAAATWGGSWLALGWWGLTGIGVVILANQSLVALFLLCSGRSGLWADRRGWQSFAAAAGQLPRAWRQWRNARRSGRLVAPALAACGLPADAPTRLLTSDSDTLVLAVGGAEGETVVKIAISPAASRGIDLHAAAVEGLGAEVGGDLAALLPRVVQRATLDGQRVLAETRLPGRPATDPATDPAGAEAVARAVLAAMGRIHSATAALRVIDEGLLAEWVDGPIDAIRQVYGLPGASARLDRLSAELRGAWRGRQVLTGCVHGDLWPGNVLLGGAPGTPCVSGIVDWENARTVGLPDTDLVHWWLTTRPGELGSAVLEALERPDDLRSGLARLGVELPNGDLEIEHLVLQTWLWHVEAGLARASTNRVGLVWLARNVGPVIRLFDVDNRKTTAGGLR
ncbi:phosphotransferase [Paeniglutamicibacter sp. NPDC091659]|uniref:phosphotransferase n=1 Tax=Paeniglutamicibacter sp. NPDC091659 TaxID=3364389 RepID=UPI00380761DC